MEMKKYMTPEMEVIKLSVQKSVLQAISGEGSGSTASEIPVETGGSGEVPD